MIVDRYLLRQLTGTFSGLLGILLAVVLVTRFAGYLGEAAAGKYTADFVLSVMLYRLPEFVTLAAPLAFFLAVSLVFGRLYEERELIVFHALGLSRIRLLGVVLFGALGAGALTGVFSLWLAPAAAEALEVLRIEQRSSPELNRLGAGRFQPLESGTRVTYVEDLSEDGLELFGVFIAERDREGRFTVLRADRGDQYIDEDEGLHYLRLSDGERVEVTPGDRTLRRTRFRTLSQRITWDPIRVADMMDRVPTRELLGRDDADAQAELQWRLSLPLALGILGVAGLAGAGSAAQRGGRVRLAPAIALLVTYLAALVLAREQIGAGTWPAVLGMLPLHGVFGAVAAGWFLGRPRLPSILRRRARFRGAA